VAISIIVDPPVEFIRVKADKWTSRQTLSLRARGLLTVKNVSCDGYTSDENVKSETWRCVELCVILCVKQCVP